MGAIKILGLILLIIGILLFFGPLIFVFFGIGGLFLSVILLAITWTPGIICIVIGAWLYRGDEDKKTEKKPKKEKVPITGKKKLVLFYWIFTIVLILIFLSLTICKTGKCDVGTLGATKFKTDFRCSYIIESSHFGDVSEDEILTLTCLDICKGELKEYSAYECENYLLICYCS